MDFAHDAVARDFAARTQRFLDELVLPAEPVLQEQLAATPGQWGTPTIVRDAGMANDSWTAS